MRISDWSSDVCSSELLLGFAEARTGKIPTALSLTDLDSRLLLDFLDHLEKDRGNSVRSRNARLAALRTFLKYAAHHDLVALSTIEQALAIPMKLSERPMVGFLTPPEIREIGIALCRERVCQYW